MSASPPCSPAQPHPSKSSCLWTPSDLFPCLAVFSHANQSAFSLNIHKPNLQPVFGAGGSSEGSETENG
ncbi:hypothetical protein CgunFtcFv8_001076 [Champsocephalus gunnari]|uniref:Uncharacterized protein n=1 Tax=Champsocephalus gunnari TaxID=52237 RepID=A0AAN8DU01_CHAGU|nr:hypothetical protein CgunFtcFv8_001076 [Champsocephalus gunnari]